MIRGLKLFPPPPTLWEWRATGDSVNDQSYLYDETSKKFQKYRIWRAFELGGDLAGKGVESLCPFPHTFPCVSLHLTAHLCPLLYPF